MRSDRKEPRNRERGAGEIVHKLTVGLFTAHRKWHDGTKSSVQQFIRTVVLEEHGSTGSKTYTTRKLEILALTQSGAPSTIMHSSKVSMRSSQINKTKQNKESERQEGK